MHFYSVIIPVYNRPNEIDELLESLTHQTYTKFEVIVIEDGSTNTCEEIIDKYKDQLSIRYHFKENSGQGFSRNVGFDMASGDYYIVFDSDCLIPKHYFQAVEDFLEVTSLDAFGGPDKSHKSFTNMQKAISYSMTSVFTTGGIRGNKNHYGTFHPRSFNMGISKEVYQKLGGYIITRMGEDLEFSIRIIKSGFVTGLIPEAYVYHKRRTSLIQFYKQLHFFGRARINVGRFFPEEVRLFHWFPAFFTLGFISIPFWFILDRNLGALAVLLYLLFFTLNFLSALWREKSFTVAIFSVATSFVQLFSYGVGFMTEKWLAKKEINQHRPRSD